MPILFKDDNGAVIQGFIPDPDFAQVPLNLAGTKVLQKGAGGDVNIGGWLAVRLRPSADIQLYLNGQSTKYITLDAGVREVILIHPDTTSITLSGTATVEVEGM